MNKRIKKKKEKESLMQFTYDWHGMNYSMKERRKEVNEDWKELHEIGCKIKLGHKSEFLKKSRKNIKVTAEWTGSYPCLCSGEWILIVNGENVSNKIPDELRCSPMDTYGYYRSWHFEEDWEEVWETYEDGYEDGYELNEWLERNKWINDISKDRDIQEDIYYAFQQKDWREGECGGCI